MREALRRLLAAGLAAALAVLAVPAAGAASCTEVAAGYEAVFGFSEGLAPVRQNGKWGYLDESGRLAIPCRYDRAYRFSGGLAVVGTGAEEWEDGGVLYDICEMGFVDRQGRYTAFVCPYAEFDEAAMTDIPGPLRLCLARDEGDGARRFVHGYFSAGELLYGPDGRARTGLRAGGWQVTEGLTACGSFFTDVGTGERITVPAREGYRVCGLRPFNQGLAPAGLTRTGGGQGGCLWGFVDRTGAWVIQPQYRDFMVSDAGGEYEVFGETGLAMVQAANGKWGAVDRTGAEVIPFRYDALRPYSMGLAPFCRDGRYGFLNAAGTEAIAPRYLRVSGFGASGYAAVSDGRRTFLIDRTGRELAGVENLSAGAYFPDGPGGVPETRAPGEYVILEESGRYGLGRVDYAPEPPARTEMDGWAWEEASAAVEAGLVPPSLQALYRQDITRGEFCALVMRTVETALGESAERVVLERTGGTLDSFRRQQPFLDASGDDVIAAYALKIVDGRGGGRFDPYAPISRQEAAALLARTARVLGLDTGNAADAGFADGGEVGKWFVADVNYVARAEIMTGTGGGRFSPALRYTREQAYVTVYRLFGLLG